MNNDFQNLINEIKEKADIVSIIGQYVKLEKQGSSYVGLCPFHEDKHPSMSVSPTKKVYKCFSCNAGGNVITFVEKFKKIPFMEALREVGATVGITVSTTKKEVENQRNSKFYSIVEDASTFYQFYLKNTKDGIEAISYLNNRHLNDDIIKNFKIGLSSSGDNDLVKYLISKNHLPIDIVEVGLAFSTPNGFYDRFKNRIMFPIKNLNGNIVGFSGRKYLLNNEDAKYINTTETIIFKKGQILYNYNEAISSVKSQNCIFLFEGFMDVIAAYRANICNCVASMGTALTFDQIKAIKRLTNNIIVCYDGDAPGIEATKRAIQMLLQNEMNIKIISLPDNLDPDEYINKYGEKELYDFLTTKSLTAIEFLYQQTKNDLIANDIDSIEIFKNKVFSFLKTFNSNVICDNYLKKLSDDINASLDALTNDYQLFLEKSVNEFNLDVPIKKVNTRKKITRKFSFNKYIAAERQLIQLAYQNNERCNEIVSKLNNNYVMPENNIIMCKINQYYVVNQVYDYDRMKQKFTPDELDLIKEIMNSNMLPDVSQIDILIDTVKKCPYNRKVKEILEKDEKDVNDLKELTEMKRKMINIKRKKEI